MQRQYLAAPWPRNRNRDVNSGEAQIAFLKLKNFWRHFLLIITLTEPSTCTQCQVFVEKEVNLVFETYKWGPVKPRRESHFVRHRHKCSPRRVFYD